MSEPAYTLPTPEDHDGQIWPVQGAWTYEDYVRLPEDGLRYEVIRGTLYVTATPIYDHQYAVQTLAYAMHEWVRKHRLGVVLGVPFDIRLPNQIGDPVEPDLVFFRRGNQPRSGDPYFQGVPDLIVEVLSPSTRHRDRGIKLEAYRDAGVPEYWLVDPKARTVVVQVLSDDCSRYTELCRGGVGETVTSAVLSGLRIEVEDLFP